jgi:putative addiction module component (TIGR02574 family)
MSTLPELVSSLTPAERLELIEILWDSLSATDEPQLTEAQGTELESRVLALERGELGKASLEEVISKIRDGDSS